MNRKDRKFADRYHDMAEELRQARERLATIDRANELTVAKAVEQAVEAATRPLIEEINRATGALGKVGERLRSIGAAEKNAIDKVNALARTIQDRDARIEELTADRDVWKRAAAEAQPRVDAAEGKVAELQAVLDRVNDRMHRREIDRVEAVANRKVLAGAMPGRRTR
jgi:chromosome segregation ATPase